MIRNSALLGMALLLSVSSLASAQETQSFKRDRNVSAAQSFASANTAPGVIWGAFTARPAINLGLETNDNIYYRANNQKSDTILSVAPSLAMRSNWGRHSLSLNAATTVTQYSEFEDEGTDSWTLGARGRLDVVAGSYFFGGLNGFAGSEPRGEELTSRDLAKPISFKVTGASAGYNHEFNRLKFVAEVRSAEFDYDDAYQVGGAISDQDIRDRKVTNLIAKSEYAVSPDTSLYIIYDANNVDYDLVTSNRDSEGYDVALGADFDVSDFVRGQVQIGYLKQDYDNPAFAGVDGMSHKVRLEWFPTPLTTLSINTGRTVQETPAVGASGYIQEQIGVSIDHQLRQNLLVSASYRAGTDDYNGVDREDERTRAMVSAQYSLNRNVKLTGSFEQTKLDSSGANRLDGYTNNAFKLGVTLAY